MLPRPLARSSEMPKNGGDTPFEEFGFAPEMAAAPPVATDILLQFSPGADPAQMKAALRNAGRGQRLASGCRPGRFFIR